MSALTPAEADVSPKQLPPIKASPQSSVRSNFKWSSSVENLISFHFSLLPFFESKKDSDKFLLFDSVNCLSSVEAKDVTIEADQRCRNLDAIFVKTIFPFIERRISEEGIWRKSGNFARIKRLQKELTILTTGLPRGNKAETAKKSTSSKSSLLKSTSSVDSIETSRSMSSSTNSLDEIDDDDCEYSVHDMTTTVKRMLIPDFLEDPSIRAFLNLVQMLSDRVPENIVSCPDESSKFKEDDPRLFSNFISSLSLFLLFHLKVNHSVFWNQESEQKSTNFMNIFCSFMNLMSTTVDNSHGNKMVASNVATLLLPLFYPSSTDDMVNSTTSPVEGGFKAGCNRHLFMLSFIIQYWVKISSSSSFPSTFMTDFKRLMSKSRKRKSNESAEKQEEDENVMSTCVRFAVSNNGNMGGLSETELELARLYAHVHASKDKKMIKKLNRAGIMIPPSSSKKTKGDSSSHLAEANKTPARTPCRSKISSLRSIFSSAKKKSESIRKVRGSEKSPSSYDLSESPGTASSTPSNSFEVLRFS